MKMNSADILETANKNMQTDNEKYKKCLVTFYISVLETWS
jgi:hypothetical protein